MHKWVIASVLILSGLTSFIVIKYSMGPKPIRIIKPSNFPSPEVFGNYIFRQLYQPLKQSPQIFFGLNTQNEYERRIMESLLILLEKDLGRLPEILVMKPEDSFKKQSQNASIHLTFINLKDVLPAEEILPCDEIKDHQAWFSCSKSVKVRQINKARKVNLEKPVGLLEWVSKNDIIIYFKE